MDQSFESLINSVEAIIWEADFKSSALSYVSKYVVELLGYPLSTWLDDPTLFARICHPEDFHRVAAAKDSVTPEKDSYQVVYRLFKSNGEIVWLADRVKVVFEDSRAVLLRGVSFDVTERRLVEEALSLVLEVTSCAAKLPTQEEIIAAALTRISQLTGQDAARCWYFEDGKLARLGASFQKEGMVEPLLLDDCCIEALTGLAINERGPVFAPRLESGNHSFASGFAFPVMVKGKIYAVFEFLCLQAAAPRFYLDKALAEIMGHLGALLEQRMARELLHQQKVQEQRILDSMPSMVFFKDRENRIIRVNRAAAAMIGLSPEEMIGRLISDLYPSEAEGYYFDDLEVINSGNPKLGIIESIADLSGKRRWISTDKIPLRDQFGSIIGVVAISTDITKLKEVEAELLAVSLDLEAKVEERTRELNQANIFFSLSRDMLCIATKEGYFKRVNSSWSRKLGYSTLELTSTPFLEFVHPDDREMTKAQLGILLSGGYVDDFENRYIAIDGSIVWLLWSASSSLEAEYIYGVAYDITDRKKAEREILDLSQAMKNAVEGIAKLDLEMRYLSVNQSYASLHGLENADDLLGRPANDLIASEDIPKWQACFESMLADGKAEVELLGRTVDGRNFHEQVTMVKALDEHGDVSGFYLFDKDITARKQTEASLKHSEDRFHQLALHVPGGIYQYLLRSDGSIAWPYVSPGCEQILGISADVVAVNPRSVYELIFPDDLPRVFEAIEKSKRELSVFVFEGRISTPQGQRWILAQSTPDLLENGDIIFNGLLTDITDKKRSEEEIRNLNSVLSERVEKLAAVNSELESLTRKLELAYDAAMEASNLKSEFVANISHEIRTPISAVIGMSELLLDTTLSEEQRQFTNMVKDSAQSLLTIINDILDFSKVEAGYLELEETEFSLLALVEDCAELLGPTVRKKQLSFLTMVDAELPSTLRGDPIRLRQILLNLASNAVKFTASGDVFISVSKRQAPDGSYCRFTVSDTGIGLSESARKRLFTPFVQADGSTTRNYGGTGLGLSISKLLVDLMGGSIGFDSREGEGSSFWFEVPINKSDARSLGDMLSAAGLQSKSKKTVLLASFSDNTIVCLENYLKASRLPIDLTAIHLSEEGEEAPTRAFDLVIFDGLMDGGSSEEVNPEERLLCQSREVLATLPTLRLSENQNLLLIGADPTTASQTLSVSAANISPQATKGGLLQIFGLVKPFRAQDMIELVKSVLFNGGLPISKSDAPLENVPDGPGRKSDLGAIKVLIAEDNAVMQELAIRQVYKLGLKADLAANGREAVQLVRTGDYALVLMDCQMPEVDGYEATMMIRKEESERGGHIPIIAMTASAMKGDRENCIASGMDDYLSKPVGQNELLVILEKWMPQAHWSKASMQKPKETKTNGRKTPIDLSSLAELYGAEDLPRLLESFLNECSQLLAEMEAVEKVRDYSEMARLAHQLKGLAVVMTAIELSEQALLLEQACRRASPDVSAILTSLKQTCRKVSECIAGGGGGS